MQVLTVAIAHAFIAADLPISQAVFTERNVLRVPWVHRCRHTRHSFGLLVDDWWIG